MKKTSKSNSRQQDARIITKPAKPSAWDEPRAFERCRETKVLVASHDDDRGSYHALQHRSIERVDENVDGRVKTVTRTISTVRQMCLDGEISIEQHQQATEYKLWFDRACMDALRASPMDGMPRTGGKFMQVDEHPMVHRARIKLAATNRVLDGPESRMGKAMYHVVGMERGFGGREVSGSVRSQRKKDLIKALERLVSRKNGQFKNNV